MRGETIQTLSTPSRDVLQQEREKDRERERERERSVGRERVRGVGDFFFLRGRTRVIMVTEDSCINCYKGPSSWKKVLYVSSGDGNWYC